MVTYVMVMNSLIHYCQNIHGYCSVDTDYFNLQNTVIKEEMVDTPVAVISRESERVNVSFTV